MEQITKKLLDALKKVEQQAESKEVQKFISVLKKEKIGSNEELLQHFDSFVSNLTKSGEDKEVEPLLDEVLSIIGELLPEASGGPEDEQAIACPSKFEGVISFDDIAGLHREKGEMEINFIYPNIYSGLFKTKSNSVLLYGPPGTGKSTLVNACAKELSDTAFFNIMPSTILGKYVGQAEKNISKVFKCARDALKEKGKNGRPKYNQVALFFDEFEALAASRDEGSNSTKSTVTSLLQEFGGVDKDESKKVAVVAATNYPWQLDSAILRRFKNRIFIDLPTYEARTFLVKTKLFKNYSFPPSRKLSVDRKEDIEHFGRIMAKYSEAKEWKNVDENIKKICQMTGPRSVSELMFRTEEDEPYTSDDALSQYGYSSSDVDNMMDIAFSIAARRAISETAVYVPVQEGQTTYYIYSPDGRVSGGLKIEQINDKKNILTFDLKVSDVEQACALYPSTIVPTEYEKLLKYARGQQE